MPDNDANIIMEKIRTVNRAPMGIVDRLLQLAGGPNEIVYTNVGRVDEESSIQVVVFTRTSMLVQTFPANYEEVVGAVMLEAWPRRKLHHVEFSEKFVLLNIEAGEYRVKFARDSCASLYYRDRPEPIKLLPDGSADDAHELLAFLPSLLAD